MSNHLENPELKAEIRERVDLLHGRLSGLAALAGAASSVTLSPTWLADEIYTDLVGRNGYAPAKTAARAVLTHLTTEAERTARFWRGPLGQAVAWRVGGAPGMSLTAVGAILGVSKQAVAQMLEADRLATLEPGTDAGRPCIDPESVRVMLQARTHATLRRGHE